MSLFDKLKDTKLKSLKFSSDKPGGGTSLEPVIRKPILDNNLVGQERSFNDVAEENRARIAKILKSTSRGTRFVRNQIGLQISNAHLETSNAPVLNTIELGGGFIGAINKGINFINTANSNFNPTTAAQTTRLTPLHAYSSEVTLAQLESGNGTHLDRFGLTPFIEDRYKYINIAKANNTAKDNRLTKLRTKLNVGYDANPNVQVNQLKNKVKSILSGVSSITNLASSISNLFGGSPFLNSVNNKVNNVTKVVSPFLVPQLDQYIGGPGSRFGIGATNIRRFDFTNKLKDFEDLKILSNSKAGDARIDVDKYLNSRTATKEFLFVNPKAVFDFPDSAKILFTSPVTSNKTYNALKTKPTQIVAPSTYRKSKQSPITVSIKSPNINKSTEKFNYLKNAFAKGGVYDQIYNREDDKIMSVEFNQLNPFTGSPLALSVFSAYLSGYSEDYNSNWTDIKYNGRSEFFYTFNSFKKTASFKLNIPIFKQQDLIKKHDDLRNLQKSAAGAYLDTRLGGVITKIKLGHYLNYVPCIITNLKITIPNDASWDWGIDNKDGNKQAYAMLLEADFSITVIGDEIPGWDLGKTPNPPPVRDPEPTPIKLDLAHDDPFDYTPAVPDATSTKFSTGINSFAGIRQEFISDATKLNQQSTAYYQSLADALTKKNKK